MVLRAPGEVVFVGDYADKGDTSVAAGSASSGWQIRSGYTFVPRPSFAYGARGEVLFVGDYADKNDTTVRAHESDSGWEIWDGYIYHGLFPTNKPCPDADAWAIVG
jgi:hypothetical protein